MNKMKKYFYRKNDIQDDIRVFIYGLNEPRDQSKHVEYMHLRSIVLRDIKNHCPSVLMIE